jgi:hypothetical protein
MVKFIIVEDSFLTTKLPFQFRHHQMKGKRKAEEIPKDNKSPQIN